MKMEKHIEEKLRKEVCKKSGLCLKFVSPGTNGMPDRIIFMPEGKIYFVETKSKTGRPSAIQVAAHRQLEKYKYPVRVINNEETLKQFLDGI